MSKMHVMQSKLQVKPGFDITYILGHDEGKTFV